MRLLSSRYTVESVRGSVPALKEPRTLDDIYAIAGEDHAQHVIEEIVMWGSSFHRRQTVNELQRHYEQSRGLGARLGQPLIVLLVGDDEVRYFTSDEDADAYLANERSTEPINLAGIWSDMDWKEADKALDRIRHGSEPTPPIDSI